MLPLFYHFIYFTFSIFLLSAFSDPSPSFTLLQILLKKVKMPRGAMGCGPTVCCPHIRWKQAFWESFTSFGYQQQPLGLCKDNLNFSNKETGDSGKNRGSFCCRRLRGQISVSVPPSSMQGECTQNDAS